MEALNKKQVRIYLGDQALALATNKQETSGKNFSQTIEDLILNGLEIKEANNAKQKNNTTT
ncbi:hypothetical protein N9301_09170 [Paracoccaceae bacterium]|jgi:hypothetical protein|nr:hypothetical protein [Paracoccaceae bacterium]|tara:strand:+ start:215 stop:397 length:183 start_codon:yes stop_codon:yes gene_type:complete